MTALLVPDAAPRRLGAWLVVLLASVAAGGDRWGAGLGAAVVVAASLVARAVRPRGDGENPAEDAS